MSGNISQFLMTFKGSKSKTFKRKKTLLKRNLYEKKKKRNKQ